MKKKTTTPENSDLIFDPKEIGERLLKIRKRKGLSQEETAWATGLSARAYADIERGTVNARLTSIMSICNVFGITPNDILVREREDYLDEGKIITNLDGLPPSDHEKALRMLQLYIELCNR